MQRSIGSSAGRAGLQALESRLFSGLIFLLPALAITTHYGIGLIEVAILLGALVYARPLWRGRAALFGPTGFIVGAFAFNLLAILVSLAWSGWHSKYFDNQFRQLLLLPAIGLIVLKRPAPRALWYGLFVGTIGAAGVALYQRFGLHVERVSGFHLSIMFGDIAIAMGIMALAAVPLLDKTRLVWLPYGAFLAGLLTSILSVSRGGWVALPVCLLCLYWQNLHISRPATLRIAALMALLFGALYFIPQLGVAQRIAEVASDITQFRHGFVDTSIGLRFEMWRGAWTMFIEHPLLGVGRANFHQGLLELVARGALDPAVRDYYHAHNELFHALATEGVLGALALVLLYLAPLQFFARRVQRRAAGHEYAWAGLLLVLSFISFGLTQVMFAHHVGAAFYAAGVSFLAGLCLLHAPPAQQTPLPQGAP